MALLGRLHRIKAELGEGAKRPVEGRARTCPTERPDVHQHSGSSRLTRFSCHHRQCAPVGTNNEVYGLGGDQIATPRTGRVAHNRMPWLGTANSRVEA